MRRVTRFLAALISLVVALVQANCDAQVFQNSFKPRVVYERELEQAPQEIRQNYRDAYFTKSNRGILTRLGTELLLNDPANRQIHVVDIKTLAEDHIPLAFPAIEVQTEAQTDMLFVNTFKNGAIATQTCYENLNAFKNEQPNWTLEHPGMFHSQQVRWLNEHQRFIVYSLYNGHLLILLDQNGVKLAEHDFNEPILIIGVDETQKGFNIFYLTRNRNTPQNPYARQFVLTQLDDNFKVRKTQKWPAVDRPLVDRRRNLGSSFLGISRSFRLRGLKSGEVTKYFLEDAPQPGYLDMNGRLPIGNFSSKWFSYANKLSAAESPLQPEIVVSEKVVGSMMHDEFILFDQQSNYYHVPDQCLTDAFFDDERKMIVTVADTKKRGTWKVRLISFE